MAAPGSSGRLYCVDAAGTTVASYELNTQRPLGLAWDGRRLWYLDTNLFCKCCGIYAVDTDGGRRVGHASCSDVTASGLAYGNDRLWISARRGVVYEVDPGRLLETGKMESAILQRFPGTYKQLSFDDGWLWGFDEEMNRICKINVRPVTSTPSSATSRASLIHPPAPHRQA